MFGAEQDRPKIADHLGEFHGSAVLLPFAGALPIPVVERLFAVFGFIGDPDMKSLFSESDQILVAGAPIALSPCEKVNAFERVGLALRVLPVKQIDAGHEVQAGGRDIPVVFRRQGQQVHVAALVRFIILLPPPAVRSSGPAGSYRSNGSRPSRPIPPRPVRR